MEWKLCLTQLLFLLYCFNFSLCEKDVEIKLIQDFIRKQTEPNLITALLCWHKADLVKLQHTLFKENTLSVIHNIFIDRLGISRRENFLIVVDLSCSNYKHILQKAHNEDLFRVNFRWLALSHPENELEIHETIKNLNVFIDSRFVIAQKISHHEYDLNYIYKLEDTTNLITTKLGKWDKEKGFSYFNYEAVSWTRRKLKGHELKTSFVVVHNESFDHLEDYRFGDIDYQLKMNYFISRYLFHYMNATRVLVYDTTWGEYRGNNTYNGLLGRMHRKEIHIAGSPMFCILERQSIYECVAMVMPVIGFFMFKQPPLSYVANIYTLPFETDLWLTNIAFLGICSMFLYFIIRWEWNILRSTNGFPEYDRLNKSFWESIMFTIGAVCQQGYPTEPKSGSGKIITLTLFFTLIFVFTAYCANTVVLFQSSASNIRTLEDLYNSKMEMGVDDQPYLRFWFPRTVGYWRRKIYTDRIAPKGENPHFVALEEGIDRMRDGYYAFHTDEIGGYKLIGDKFEEHEKCGLQSISYLHVSNPWITCPRNSSYKEIFSVGYRLLVERGMTKREMKKIYPKKPECISQGSNFRSAGILDLYSVYMLFIFGLSGSLLILILEIISKRYIELYFQRKRAIERDVLRGTLSR